MNINKEIVVSASFKDLNWLNDLHDIKKTIYRKGSEIKNENEIKIELNKGVAEHTYYYHIYHNYDNLSDITFFVQDFPFDHWHDIIEIINNNNWEQKNDVNIDNGYYGFHSNSTWKLYDSDHFKNGKIIHCLSNGNPQHTFPDNFNVDMYWDMLFEEKKPDKYEFIPGTHFAITKNHVKIRSKEFYRHVMNLLVSNEVVPHMIERLNSYIFDKKLKTKL